MIRQQPNYTQFDLNYISSLPVANIIIRLNQTQVENLLFCDRDNRAHSQQWLVYTYLQTGQYNKSMSLLNDLIQSNQIYSTDYYLPYTYRARAYIITNIFFWAMYDKEKNQDLFLRTINEVLAGINSSSIEQFRENIGDVWQEAGIRFGKFYLC